MVGAGHVGDELVEENAGIVWIGGGEGLANRFLVMPGHADLASGVAGLEAPDQLLIALVVEAFVTLGEQPP